MEQINNITKKRKWKQITERDRYKIEALLASGMRPSDIARQIGCSKRTIERERKRGLTEQLRPAKKILKKGDVQKVYVYFADVAQVKHENASLNKGRNLKIGSDHELVKFIEEKIGKEHWSPGAVIGYIEAKELRFKTSICVKTLYNYIDKGLFPGISNKELLHKKNKRKRRQHRVRRVSLNNRNGKSIEYRPIEYIPIEAENREEFGHWEIDLVIGKKGTKPVILTIVERKTRKSLYVLVKKQDTKGSDKSDKKVKKRVGGDFSQVFKTITADNGSEFLDGSGIKRASGCDEVYYAHPYSSYERGSNENGNGILRRFLPKGTDFSKITKKELQRIEDRVNNYPRKVFKFKSADEMYCEAM